MLMSVVTFVFGISSVIATILVTGLSSEVIISFLVTICFFLASAICALLYSSAITALSEYIPALGSCT